MLQFRIDQNDASFSIVDGGCVDGKLKTLKTSELRLDYNSNLIDDISQLTEIVLNVHCNNQDLFDRAFYVMCGTMIDLDNTNNTLNVSFGGLRAEFKLTAEQCVRLSQTQPQNITTSSCVDTEIVYVYFLGSQST